MLTLKLIPWPIRANSRRIGEALGSTLLFRDDRSSGRLLLRVYRSVEYVA